ncbi:9914_t:CDS:2 [Funneliformis caledonium]|uniref:9914_t:CDS:1 n=1 Tax=Funneliformis caledonium TaxID=1117310 RepID=A0A9N8YTV5_9GLOM|nr:9914_t:CDS:2 [Funneliformis caledonium]
MSEILEDSRIIYVSTLDTIEPMINSSTLKTSKFRLRYEKLDNLEEFGTSGKGVVFNYDLKSWKYNKQFFIQSITSHGFLRETVKETNKLFKELESCWDLIGKEGLTSDFTYWTHSFTSDLILFITTGRKGYCMEAKFNEYYKKFNQNLDRNGNDDLHEEKIKKCLNLFHDVESLLAGYSYFVMFPSFVRNYFPIMKSKTKSILDCRDRVFNGMLQIINERREEIEQTPLGQPLRNDMLTSFITANTSRDISEIRQVEEELMRPMTNDEIKVNLLEAITAGLDTMANTIAFTVYYICQYPEVKKRRSDSRHHL